MLVTVFVVGFVLTIATLLLTLFTISKGYSYVHTIDPLKEGDEVREFTGNGKRM